jgi:hypothetical protein
MCWPTPLPTIRPISVRGGLNLGALRQGLVTFQPARPRLARHRRRDVNAEGYRAMIPQALTPPPGGLPSTAGQFVARPVAGSASLVHNY